MPSAENPSWLFDCPAIDDFTVSGGLFTVNGDGPYLWENHERSGSSRASMEASGCFIGETALTESSSRKRPRPEGSCVPGSKARREKMRRDKLNDKFMELAAILDPEKAPKMDKAVILIDATRVVTHLRNEAQRLKDSNHNLKENINELKREKSELRDEKQRLKEEKSCLEQQIKAMSMQPSFLSYHPPMMPCFPSIHSDGSKLPMPYIGHPGFVFQFHAPANADDRNELPPAA